MLDVVSMLHTLVCAGWILPVPYAVSGCSMGVELAVHQLCYTGPRLRLPYALLADTAAPAWLCLIMLYCCARVCVVCMNRSLCGTVAWHAWLCWYAGA